MRALLALAQRAEQAGFDDLFLGFDEVRRAFALGADLDDALVPAGGGEHGMAFRHIDADRLLDVHVGAGLEQPLAPRLGQLDDLLAAAPAVGGVGLVRQIDEVALREPPRQFTMDGQAAHAGVENANSHRRALEQCDDVSNPIGEKIASLSGDARSMCA